MLKIYILYNFNIMRLGVIVDSICGLTKNDVEKKSWFFLPLHINIDGVEYKDGLDIDDNKFYNIISLQSDVSTASSSFGEITNVFQKASAKYDYVIYFPISKFLSSQSQIAQQLLSDFKNVRIVDSHSIGTPIITLLEKAEKLAQEGIQIDQIMQRINKANKKNLGMILPETMDWLKKGGRINKSTAMLGNIFSIVPVLFFDGRLDKWGKGRSLSKTMLKAFYGLIEKLGKNWKYEYDFCIFYAHKNGDPSYIQKDHKIMKIIEKEIGHKIDFIPLSRTLVMHVGIGTFSIQVTPKKM